MSTHEIQSESRRSIWPRFIVEPMQERHLWEVVEIEESSGLNRWGYEAYKREIYTNPNSLTLVARSLDLQPGVLGFLAGWIVEDELHINNIASSPEYRRRGIGRALMEVAMDEARLRGGMFVLLEVRSSNHIAQLLYRSLGFNIVGHRREYYRSPTEDALVMKRAL